MMPVNTKLRSSLVIVSLVTTATLNTQTALAQVNKPRSNQESNLNFCTLLMSDKLPHLGARLDEGRNKLQARHEQREQNLEEKRLSRNKSLAERRQNWNNRREALYAKLMERAQTEEQKQAVIVFQQAVQAAVTARQAAIDAALNDWRRALDQAIKERQTAIEAALNDFRTASQTALEQAKADCAAGKDPSEVRQNFKAAMKAAHDKFKADRETVAKIPNSLKTAADDRKAAVTKAIADFKTALQQALTDLKTALGEPTPTP